MTRFGFCMAMLSTGIATNTSEACPITSTTKVVIYGGRGATAECKQWEADFYKWAGLEAVSISAEQLQSAECGGSLRELGVKIIVCPGGDAYDTQLSVKTRGKQNILSFIDAGGLYVGTCAGFYLAASGYVWEDGQEGGGEFKWPYLLGRFPEVEGSITSIKDDTGPVPYKLTGLDNGLHAIYWGGPTRGWHKTEASVPGTVLLRYSDVPGNLLAAVHVNDKSHGNLLLFSAHLEAEEGVGIHNTGLTKEMQLANWQYRAQQIKQASKLEFTVPSTLPMETSVHV